MRRASARRLAGICAGAALLGLIATLGPAGPAAQAGAAAPAGPPGRPGAAAQVGVELAGQTPVVRPGERLDLRLRLHGAPAGGSVQLVLHQRVRSRSEFTRSAQGRGLRGVISSGTVVGIEAMPFDPLEGAHSVSLSLDPGIPGGIGLTAPGVYPLRVRVLGADGAEVASVITHLVLHDPADRSPPLHVAVVAELAAPPALGPDGGVAIGAPHLARLEGLAGALARVPTVPVSLAIRPETLDALAGGAGGERGAQLLAQLRSAAPGRTVLATPYAEICVETLVDAGLAGEIDHQILRGAQVLMVELGVEPDGQAWVASPRLGADGAAALAQRGVEALVVAVEGLSPGPDGVLTPAQRYSLVDNGRDLRLDAIPLDPHFEGRLTAPGSPGLLAQRLISELAVIWSEQPAKRRGVALRVDQHSRPEVLAALLSGLGRGGMLQPVDLPGLFDRAAPATDPAGSPIERELRPERAERLDPALVRRIERARERLAGYASLFGGEDPRVAALGDHLLVATADGARERFREGHVEAVMRAVEEVVRSVRLPELAITLTGREGTLPVTIQNTAATPLEVRVRLRSAHLEFLRGEEMPARLTGATTRIEVPVRARASGTSPLEVTVESPDGRIVLAQARYSVRSQVSGLGLVLSGGAAVFLAVWWLSNWRKTRRNRHLVPRP